MDHEVWYVRRGDDWQIDFLVPDTISLTGATLAGEITWRRYGLSQQVLPLVQGTHLSIIVASGVTTVRVKIADADGALLPLGQLSELQVWRDIGVDRLTIKTMRVEVADEGTPPTQPPQAAELSVAAVEVITDILAGKANKAGDTFTGNVTISKAAPILLISTAAAEEQSILLHSRNFVRRWFIGKNNDLETGVGNAGSSYVLARHNDAGTFLGLPLLVRRSDGRVTFETAPFVGINQVATYTDLQAHTKWLTPEMFLPPGTVPVYCPAGNPSNYTGATDFSDAFDAMRAAILAVEEAVEWGYPDDKTYPIGIAFQPGRRYAVSRPINWTRLTSRGLVVQGNGATLVGITNNMASIVDTVGSHSWTIYSLNGESDSAAQPHFGWLHGRFTTTSQASEMTWINCFWHGWFQKAVKYNMGGEVYTSIGCLWENDDAEGSGLHIDATNLYGIAGYTVASGVTITTGAAVSCITHKIVGGSIRCVQGSTKGALRLTNPADFSSLNRLRGVHVDQAYLLNNGVDLANHPAVLIEGTDTDDVVISFHAEKSSAGATIQQSHVVLYDNSGGAIRHHRHKISEYFADAEKSIVDATTAANGVTLIDFDLSVSYSRGTDEAGSPAELFGPGMALADISGRLSVGEADPALLNLSNIRRWNGDIYANQAFSALELPPLIGNSQGRFITPTDTRMFPSGAYTPTLTNTANITSSTAQPLQYQRIGNHVHVWGLVGLTTAAAGSTMTTLGISLPIPSNFTLVYQLSGSGDSQVSQTCIIFADIANDRATLQFSSLFASGMNMYFQFSYMVL